MSGTGVGRGRGWLNLNKNQGTAKPGIGSSPVGNTALNHVQSEMHRLSTNKPTDSKFANLISKVATLDVNDDGILINQKIRLVTEVFSSDCRNESEVEEAFNYLYEKSLGDPEFASKTVTVVSSLMCNNVLVHGVKLRNLFLSKVQQEFQNGQTLQASNPTMFRVAVKMLGEFYNKARLVDGHPIAFLAEPVLQYLNMLLDSAQEADIELFAVQLSMNGPFIQNKMPAPLSKTLLKVRTVLATDNHLTATSKIWLLMALDVANCRYGVLPNELQAFYHAQLGSDQMSQIQKYNTPLSIETYQETKPSNTVQSNVNVLQVNDKVGNWNSKPGIESSQSRGQDLNINTWEPPKGEKAPRPILGAGARLRKYENSDDGWKEQGLEIRERNTWGNNSKNSKGWEHDDRYTNDYN